MMTVTTSNVTTPWTPRFTRYRANAAKRFPPSPNIVHSVPDIRTFSRRQMCLERKGKGDRGFRIPGPFAL